MKMAGLRAIYDQVAPLSLLTSKSRPEVEKRQIDSLTGLRFYAALAVFLSHLYHFSYLGIQSQAIIMILGHLGHLGVSVFYILSGFVLFTRYNSPLAKLNLKEFYVARLARVYPVFLLLTLLAIPIELFSARKADFWLNLFQNVSLTHCISQGACGSFNDVGWSISVEAFFYLMFPILLPVFYKPGRVKYLMVALVLYFAFILALPAENFYASHHFPVNRIAEFVAGMAMGKLFQQKKQMDTFKGVHFKRLATGLIACFILLLVMMPLILSPFRLLTWDYLFYIVPGAGLIFLLAVLESGHQVTSWFTSALVVFGGEISYSFYLIHNLLMRYVEHGLNIIFRIKLVSLPVWAQLASAGLWLTVSLMAAAWLYLCVEKPFRQNIRLWASAMMEKDK